MSDYKNKNCESFASLELGASKPTGVKQETVHVTITSENLLGGYAKSFVNECYRVNPHCAEQVNINKDEVMRYCEFILNERIKSVNGDCPEFRRLKTLAIPAWIQYNISMVGIVYIRDKGLKLVPVMEKESDMTLEEAFEVSEKIAMFEDELSIMFDAMPRDIEGNRDVMSTAMIAGYVRAIEPVEHVASTYVTAFLGMKLREEAAMQVLYRVQYDEVEFIASALTRQRSLYE